MATVHAAHPFEQTTQSFYPKRFIPPPVPIKPCVEGLEVNDKGHFGSLFQAMYLQNIAEESECF